MGTIKLAEYIWMDGHMPTQHLRSKARVIYVEDPNAVSVSSFPRWQYDGSSTYQASGHDSDLLLDPVSFVKDPIRGSGNFLVLCEVLNADGTPHSSNSRAKLRSVLDRGAAKLDAWFGFEQEYTLFEGREPLGWPKGGYPAPQGPFYCGIGADECFGRPMIERHTQACIDAGIMIYGINSEVMPGQWEFQVGHRGFPGEEANPLATADHLWFARYLLYRVGEDFGVNASLNQKPIRGDWNGAGMHTNFSTKEMRDPRTGRKAVDEIIKRLEAKHQAHLPEYGHGLEQRLTGYHETASMETFIAGVANRGASVRIPRSIELQGFGYIEDRRPGANADPYRVAARILKSAADLD
ncbi:MAG: glutamine synthetase beta-grasp domain-containing protein [Deltaproteobacteria bacterium]|nr:glutamine synthetase beta-grasp domain-containing protein [Deltaproteobacteria bacterium]